MSCTESAMEVWATDDLKFYTGIKSSEIHAKKYMIYSSGVWDDSSDSKQKTNLMPN